MGESAHVFRATLYVPMLQESGEREMKTILKFVSSNGNLQRVFLLMAACYCHAWCC